MSNDDEIIAAAAASLWEVEESAPRTTGGLWYISCPDNVHYGTVNPKHTPLYIAPTAPLMGFPKP